MRLSTPIFNPEEVVIMYRFIALLLFSWLLFTVAQAATITVSPADTLQFAVNSATNGDTILIADGHYQQTTVVYGKWIYLASNFLVDGDSAHIAATVFSPGSNPDSGSCFVFAGWTTGFNRLIGLTMENGTGTYWDTTQSLAGGAVWIPGGFLMMENCHLQHCSSVFGGGVGVTGLSFQHFAALSMSDCRLEDCDASGYGGGLYAFTTGSLNLNNCSFWNDTCVAPGGGSYIQAGQDVEIQGCSYSGCSGAVGGLRLASCTGNVINCQFNGNNSNGQGLHYGSQLDLLRSNGMQITGCVISGSTSPANPNVVLRECVAPTFSQNVVSDNIAFSQARGIVVVTGTSASINYNVFRNNRSVSPLFVENDLGTSIQHNRFIRNTSLDSTIGSALTVANSPSPQFGYNSMELNCGGTVTTLSSGYILDCSNNWWADSTGPFQRLLNPSGRGDTLKCDSVHFIPWLRQAPDTSEAVGRERPDRGNVTPVDYGLNIFPNPFNPTTTIEFNLGQNALLAVGVYNIQGRRVTEWPRAMWSAGLHRLTWDGSRVSTGAYFVRLEGPKGTAVRKIMLLK